jgi:hypothetical protein
MASFHLLWGDAGVGMECFEQGVLTLEITDGIAQLRGCEAMIAMLEGSEASATCSRDRHARQTG